MPAQWMLLPVLANILLVFIVQIVMYRQRMAAVKANKVRVSEIAHRAQLEQKLPQATGSSNNFINQFELPVIFYALVAFMMITEWQTHLDFVLASLFVLTRVVHATIHCTSNQLVWRFYSYLAGTILLWIMFGHLSWLWLNSIGI